MEEVATIARLHVMRDAEYHNKVNAAMYKYAAYARYRELLGEIADIEGFILDSQELLKDGEIDSSHRFYVENVIDDMREEIQRKKKSMVAYAEAAVAVSDVMTALDDIRDDSPKWESFLRSIERFRKVYLVRACKLRRYGNTAVWSYISAAYHERQNGVRR